MFVQNISLDSKRIWESCKFKFTIWV